MGCIGNSKCVSVSVQAYVKGGVGIKSQTESRGEEGRGSDLKHETSLTIYRYLCSLLGTI